MEKKLRVIFFSDSVDNDYEINRGTAESFPVKNVQIKNKSNNYPAVKNFHLNCDHLHKIHNACAYHY